MNNIIAVDRWYSYVDKLINTSINPYHDLDAFLKLTEQGVYQLPYTEIQPLLNFKSTGNPAYLQLKGFKMDPYLIPTYEDENKIFNEKQTYYSEFWLAMIAKILGEPIGYAQERNGAVFQNVRPRRGQENKIASDSSNIVLDLHVENGYHPIRPDYLLLFALRSDRHHQGHTLAVEIEKILPFLTPNEINLLRKKQFRTSVDWNFGNLNADRGSGPLVSILFGDQNSPMIFYDDEYVIGVNPEAQTTLDKLRNIVHQEAHGILLEPGEMLIFDNYKCLHGRTRFQAHYDGMDRWLQRLLVIRDLSLNQKLLQNSGRILDWQYQSGAEYGNVIY